MAPIHLPEAVGSAFFTSLPGPESCTPEAEEETQVEWLPMVTDFSRLG